MRVRLVVQPNPLTHTHTHPALLLTSKKRRRRHHLNHDWSVALSVLASPSPIVCLVRVYPVLFLSVAAVGWSRCPRTGTLLRFHIHLPIWFPQSQIFLNLYTQPQKPSRPTPTEKPRHFKPTSIDLLPRKERWRGRRGRQWPGSRAENLSTWWRSARSPSAATRRRARWTWAWATRASSPGDTSRFSRRVRTAPAAETSTCGASAKTGCSWTGYFRDAGLLLSSFPECKTTKAYNCT